ncbi:hypothetical protein GmHk_16G046863 [Glycine max]|nr:hypothetical protein GmHk_16G046863 [Glycine max]
MALPNFHRTSRKELFPNDKTLNPSLLCNDLDVNLHSSHSSLSLRVPLPVDHSVLSALDTSQTPPPDPLVSQPGQTRVVLSMTAVASLSSLVQKPSSKIKAWKLDCLGLLAKGSFLQREVARNTPYEVNITIPVEGYEPVEFVLTKICDYKQDPGGGRTRGWAIFGVLSCIFFVSSTLFCCGGFIYKTKVERQRGIDALPGMTILSALVELNKATHGQKTSIVHLAVKPLWERPPGPSQGAA